MMATRFPRLGSQVRHYAQIIDQAKGCLLYTSDAADELLCVDPGGRRIIKKKNTDTDTYPIPPVTHIYIYTNPTNNVSS